VQIRGTMYVNAKMIPVETSRNRGGGLGGGGELKYDIFDTL
jgi:hypothetical protein